MPARRNRLCARRALALLLVLAAGTTVGAANARAATLPPDFFGVNAFELFNSEPSSQWGVQLSEMEQGGIKLVRSDTAWATTEPNAPVNGVHTYDWSWLDQIVTALAQHQLTWYPIIDYSATWDSSVPGDVFSPPDGDADYSAYAAALVERYGPGGDFWQANPELPYLPVRQWEIWNEESGWSPGVDPAPRYIDLYLAARSAIRAVDPSAEVVVGGLGDGGDGYWAQQFIASMYQARPDAYGQIDAIAYHPYPVDATETAASTMQLIGDLRNYLNSIGDQTVPIEITEVGWTTQGDGALSDLARAQRMTALIHELASSNDGVTELMPFTWMSDPTVADGFGMFNSDGSPTLEGTAYLQAIAALESASPTTTELPGSAGPTTVVGPADVSSASRSSAVGGLSVWGLTLGQRGRLRVKITCATGLHACRGVLVVSTLPADGARSRPRRHTFSVAVGRTVTMRIGLPARLRLLARHGKLRIRIRVTNATAQPGIRLVGVI